MLIDSRVTFKFVKRGILCKIVILECVKYLVKERAILYLQDFKGGKKACINSQLCEMSGWEREGVA